MPDAEGKEPEFDDLDLPGDTPEEEATDLDLPGDEPEGDDLSDLDLPDGPTDELADLDDLPGEPFAEGAEEAEPAETEDEATAESAEGEDEEEAEEAEEAEAEGEEEEEEEEEEAKDHSKMLFYAEIAMISVASIGILAGTYFSIARPVDWFLWIVLCVYLLAWFFVPYGLWKARKTGTIYRIMLALSLMAVLTAAVYLALELKSYHYDIGATEARAAPAAQFRPSSTMAMACPIDVQFNSMAVGFSEASGSRQIT